MEASLGCFQYTCLFSIQFKGPCSMGVKLTRGKLFWLCDVTTWLVLTTCPRISFLYASGLGGVLQFLPGGWQGSETAVIVYPHWFTSSSHWQVMVARSATAHLPLGPPSASSTLGPMWAFNSTRKETDSCRKTTQSRSEAIRMQIGFSLFSWPLTFYFLCVSSWL